MEGGLWATSPWRRLGVMLCVIAVLVVVHGEAAEDGSERAAAATQQGAQVVASLEVLTHTSSLSTVLHADLLHSGIE